MLQQMIFVDLLNATSSRGLGGGRGPCNLQDGRRTAPCGRGAAHASLSATLERETENQTNDISGPLLPGLSRSAALMSSLASKLKERLSTGGSMIYRQTWKEKATPSGMRYWEHTASARRISDNDCTGWPTPDCSDRRGPGSKQQGVKNIAELAGWPTASVRDGKGGYLGGRIRDGKISTDVLDVTAQLSGWPTPTVADCSRGNGTIRPQDTGIPLPQRVAMIDRNSPARITASGELLTGSSAGMESGGQLNPAHSRWLMGFPGKWDSCGAMAMQLCRKSRRSS